MTSLSETEFFDAHKKLIIKSIEELHFDELFSFNLIDDLYTLNLKDRVKYTFTGRIGAWGNIQISHSNLIKYIGGKEITKYTVNSFFLEIKEECNISDETLAQYLEEANQTIFSDIQIEKNMKELQFDDLNFTDIDRLLPGHTKLIMNKGRIGWTQSDIQKYAPEFNGKFRLHWLAIRRTKLTLGISPEIKELDLMPSSVRVQVSKKVNLEEYFVCPVHPWQWDKYLKVQFAEDLYQSNIISLGEIGDLYLPQSSLRTLTSEVVGDNYDIKTSISILNTSCVRGIPSKYIEQGHLVSKFVRNIIITDDFLDGKIEVLEEKAAIHLSNKYFQSLPNSSYRFKELFGCVWRQSVQSKLAETEVAIPTAGLLLTTPKFSLIRKLISDSNLDSQQWLINYINVVIIPLYHLQLEHGIGLVAHGQNIILILKNSAPHKLIIKDFHGDLRLSSKSKHLGKRELEIIDILPPEYLIHDLFTGHFITLLRFLSKKLMDENLMNESVFYKLLREQIHHYNLTRKNIPPEINLLKNNFEKVLVNKVRFVAGYSETNIRLKPLQGNNIKNPLLADL